MSFTIHTNAPVSNYLIFDAPYGEVVEFDSNETFKCQVRAAAGSAVVLEFETDGLLGTIEVKSIEVAGVTRDALLFYAARSLTANLTPGSYVADVLRTDEAGWEVGFPVLVVAGITEP